MYSKNVLYFLQEPSKIIQILILLFFKISTKISIRKSNNILNVINTEMKLIRYSNIRKLRIPQREIIHQNCIVNVNINAAVNDKCNLFPNSIPEQYRKSIKKCIGVLKI